MRVRTGVGPIIDSVMQLGRRDYCRRVITMYNIRVGSPWFLCNMNQTAVYMNSAPNRTLHHIEERTVSIHSNGSSSIAISVPVTVAMDGPKLQLF